VKILAFSDLDDLLFQTHRKCPAGAELSVASHDADGNSHGWQTQTQRALMALLNGALWIPVTGRDEAAFARVTLPFLSWAVLDHGATLLEPGGAINLEWQQRVTGLLRPQVEALEAALQIADRLNQTLGSGCRIRLDLAHGQPLMVVVKHSQGDLAALNGFSKAWQRQTQSLGLRFFANGNNLSLIASGVDKAHAVGWLLERLPHDLSFGLGDSLSDAGFMNLCDFAVTPRGGQLIRAVLEGIHEQR
jgi:hypothetical protein